MSLFKKHKKVEEINIIEKQDIKEEVVEEKVQEEVSISSGDLQKLIEADIKRIKRIYDDLLTQFYMCKFFILAVAKNDEDMSYFASLEKQIAKLKDHYESLMSEVKVEELSDYANETLKRIYDDLKNLHNDCTGLLSRVSQTRSDKFNKLKMSSLAVIINKTPEELEKMDKRFYTFLNSFKSLNEASDYIYINSGELITNLVKSLMRCIDSTNNPAYKQQFNFYYFLKSDVILCLELSEWIELNNKIRHCTNVLRNVDIANYVDFQNYLIDFEIRYITLMIMDEKKRNVEVK